MDTKNTVLRGGLLLCVFLAGSYSVTLKAQPSPALALAEQEFFDAIKTIAIEYKQEATAKLLREHGGVR